RTGVRIRDFARDWLIAETDWRRTACRPPGNCKVHDCDLTRTGTELLPRWQGECDAQSSAADLRGVGVERRSVGIAAQHCLRIAQHRRVESKTEAKCILIALCDQFHRHAHLSTRRAARLANAHHAIARRWR